MSGIKRVLVLGATGGIGGETALQLKQAGWQVRALSRQIPQQPNQLAGIDWVQGDAMNRSDVIAAAKECTVIIHAVNPPGYLNWDKWVLPMLENTIAAAAMHNARVVLPGTVYNFGPDVFPLIQEDAPQNPLTKKGAIRVKMEQRLRAYSERGGRAIILRSGDFFGPRPGSSWFSQGLIKPGKPVRKVYNPCRVGVGHQWGCLPDVAQTIVRLLAIEPSLNAFERLHMAGHWDKNGTQMVEAISLVVRQKLGYTPSVSAFPWWLMRLIAPFQVTLREMMEMRYLWQQPLQLENRRLVALLGEEPHTPLLAAVEDTLTELGAI